MGRKGNRPGRKLPTPDATVKVMNDRLKVAALTSGAVVSARNAFQVARYIASPIPPRTADNSSKRKSEVNAGTTNIATAKSDPANINIFRPYRSERIANGILKMTVAIPDVVRMAPNSVTDMPSRGKKTGIATEKKPRPTANGLAPRTTRLVLVGIFPKECND